jgi:hypothetical protein
MNSYLKFTNLKNALEEEFMQLHSISQFEMKLLEVISVKASINQPLKITDVMGSRQLGSPCTIHRYLWSIRENGLAIAFHLGSDRRTKYLCVSDIVHTYYSHLGAALIQAVTGDS